MIPLPPRPGAARAADAVDVALVVLGRVEVDHVRDVGQVEAAGGDVGGDERRHLAGAEPRERPLALALRHVAVQRERPARRARWSFCGEPVGAALRPDEDEREPALGLELLDQPVELAVGGDRDEGVLDLALLALLGQLGLEAGRVARVGAGELADLAVERRREEHRLALRAAGGGRSGRPGA